MRIKCIHGYFIFSESQAGQVSDFMSLTGLELVSQGDEYTFADLANAPKYSLAGKSYLGIPAIETFEGEPWEIFEANSWVYDFSRGLVVPIASITQTTTLKLAGNRYVSPGLLLPGSITEDGRVRDYSAWFSLQTGRYLYSEVGYV